MASSAAARRIDAALAADAGDRIVSVAVAIRPSILPAPVQSAPRSSASSIEQRVVRGADRPSSRARARGRRRARRSRASSRCRAARSARRQISTPGPPAIARASGDALPLTRREPRRRRGRRARRGRRPRARPRPLVRLDAVDAAEAEHELDVLARAQQPGEPRRLADDAIGSRRNAARASRSSPESDDAVRSRPRPRPGSRARRGARAASTCPSPTARSRP